MATRYQLKTDRSGSVTSIKRTDTKTGKSETIQGSRLKRSNHSSRSSSRKTLKTYVDRFGVVRIEGRTGYNETAYKQSLKSGNVLFQFFTV